VSPILIAWMAGSAAEDFSESERPAIISEALSSLQKMLNRKIPRPEAAYFHDWQADPFFRGAYSYVPVNAMRAREVFSKPLEETLFFRGEATETKGHGSTVHGAIASGYRAASQLL
jgi:monoamine oxidase